MHLVVLILVLLVSLAIGFILGQKGIPGMSITGNVVKNCIPQSDLDFFIDKANEFQEDYAKCVQDAWALQLTCKMAKVPPVVNATK